MQDSQCVYNLSRVCGSFRSGQRHKGSVPNVKKHGNKGSLPIKVQVYNIGAIWLENYSSVSDRTKHVYLGAHFMRDMIMDQVIEVNSVKSVENDSDIMTKNQQGQLYMYVKSSLVDTV